MVQRASYIRTFRRCDETRQAPCPVGSMHFQAIIETTGSDIECLLLGLAHIADLYKQLAAVWLATAILTFTSSAADWPNAPVLITGAPVHDLPPLPPPNRPSSPHPPPPPTCAAVLALAAAAMRVMDIYAGPVSEQSAWFSTLTLPLTIVKANFQLLSDDDVDMTALAERVKVAREKQAALGEQLASAASQEDAAAEEFQVGHGAVEGSGGEQWGRPHSLTRRRRQRRSSRWVGRETAGKGWGLALLR